ARFPQGAPIALEAFLRPGSGLRAGEKGDAFVAQFEQMLSSSVTGHQVVALDTDELVAKGRGRPEQDSRDLPLQDFLVNAGLDSHSIHGSDEQSIHPAG